MPISEIGQNPERDSVIPAEAGIQEPWAAEDSAKWIPAFAGMTNHDRARLKRLSSPASIQSDRSGLAVVGPSHHNTCRPLAGTMDHAEKEMPCTHEKIGSQ